MLILASALAITCPSYTCASKSVNLYKGQCIYASKSAYYLSLCKDSLIPYCSPSTFNTSCTPTPKKSEKSSAWPGEKCSKDSNCAYGMCFESRCNSQNFAMSCNIDDQCNPGLYCNLYTYTCAFLIQPLASGCSKSTDCAVSSGCNFGICTRYYSLDSGQEVETCQNNQNSLCSSLTCGSLNGKSVCGSGVTSFNGTCNSNSDCVSSVDKVLGYRLQSECKCSFGKQAAGYCTKLPGDEEYKDYINDLKTWLYSEKAKMCNTVRRFTDECLMIYGNGLSTLEEKMFIELWPQIKDNEDCTKKIFNTKYWELEDSQVSYPLE